MSEKLHIPSHRYETDKYDKGYDRIFGKKGKNATTRPDKSDV
jgi:hypothetical protein